MDKAPIIENPQLLDAIIGNIQEGLAQNLGWLDKAYGRAERLVKYDQDGKKYYTPNVYAGGNEYKEVTPDSRIGNFCFIWVDDPQEIEWQDKISISINTAFSVIFWLDYRKIFNDRNKRNREEVKRQILDVLNGGFHLKSGRIRITQVWELAENIYKGFSLDEIDNQFLMHPYGGFRFDGELSITEDCRF